MRELLTLGSGMFIRVLCGLTAQARLWHSGATYCLRCHSCAACLGRGGKTASTYLCIVCYRLRSSTPLMPSWAVWYVQHLPDVATEQHDIHSQEHLVLSHACKNWKNNQVKRSKVYRKVMLAIGILSIHCIISSSSCTYPICQKKISHLP